MNKKKEKYTAWMDEPEDEKFSIKDFLFTFAICTICIIAVICLAVMS